MAAKRSIIPVFIPHLGCPHECVFCNQKRISGRLSPASPEDVICALYEASAEGAQLAFYGGSFTAIPVSEQLAFLEAAQPFLKSGRISSIRVSTRPDCVDKENLDMLKAHSVTTIELGAQSMDDGVLSACARGHTARDSEIASMLIKKHGMGLVLQMMTGLYGSTPSKDLETARRIAALSPDAVRIYPTVIIRDTKLHELYCSGRYSPHTVDAAVEVCSEIVPIFEKAGIPIIRLGLNPTDDLSGGVAVGGAYHPALGELVRSRIFLGRARALLRGAAAGSSAVLTVNPSCVSQMTGQKRQNVTALLREFSLDSLKIRAFDMEPGEILAEIIEKERDL